MYILSTTENLLRVERTTKIPSDEKYFVRLRKPSASLKIESTNLALCSGRRPLSAKKKTATNPRMY